MPPWSSLGGCRTWVETLEGTTWPGPASCGYLRRDKSPIPHNLPLSLLHHLTKDKNIHLSQRDLYSPNQCLYICKGQAVVNALPDALVLTSPLCFSMEVCLSVACRPGLFLLLRLELLLRAREVTGQLTAEIWRGLSDPASEFIIKIQRMKTKILSLFYELHLPVMLT